jgi:hypothetical protein
MTYNELVTAVQDYTENTFPTADINTMIRIAEQNIYNSVQIANLRRNVTGSLAIGSQYLGAPDDFLSVYSLAVIDPDTNEYLYLINKDVNFMREAYPNPSTSTATYRGKPKYYGIFGPQYTNQNELSFIVGPTPDKAYSAELHYYYYPASIVPNPGVIASVSFSGGSGYANGTYSSLPLTGGTGTGAAVTVYVSGGAISNVTIVNGGKNYTVGNTLSLNTGYINGTGAVGSTTLTITSVATQNPAGYTWLGDNFDSALFNGTMIEAITYMKGEEDLVKMYQSRYVQSIALLKNLGDGKQRMDAYRDGQVRNPVS